MSEISPILDRAALASLLSVGEDVVARLVTETDVPCVRLAGAERFVTDRVVAWLAEREGELLPEAATPARAAPKASRRVALGAAGPGETPFAPDEALDALAADAQVDPGRNLDRQKLRDALVQLNDELLPLLNRLSRGRLHCPHDEKERTTAWRLDEHPEGRIAAISMTWGEGSRGAPQFVGQSRVEVELAHSELVVALHLVSPHRSPTLDAAIEAARDAGFATDRDDDVPATIAKVYPLSQPAPSRHAIVGALDADLRVLVPIWMAATEP